LVCNVRSTCNSTPNVLSNDVDKRWLLKKVIEMNVENDTIKLKEYINAWLLDKDTTNVNNIPFINSAEIVKMLELCDDLMPELDIISILDVILCIKPVWRLIDLNSKIEDPPEDWNPNMFYAYIQFCKNLIDMADCKERNKFVMYKCLDNLIWKCDMYGITKEKKVLCSLEKNGE